MPPSSPWTTCTNGENSGPDPVLVLSGFDRGVIGSNNFLSRDFIAPVLFLVDAQALNNSRPDSFRNPIITHLIPASQPNSFCLRIARNDCPFRVDINSKAPKTSTAAVP
jgi:hypothetical protein